MATPNTEKIWLDAARGRTVRDVERLVSGRARGSLPSDPADESQRRHVLRFEVSGEVLAAFRDATARLQHDAGGGLDDDAVLLLMARHVLEGPGDEGRASYQVELSVCEDCQRARQQAAGDLIEVPAAVVEMASCDAQQLPRPHVGAKTTLRKPAKQCVPPALRREVLRRDRRSCQAPGCRHHTFLDLHHIVARSEEGPHEADNLVTLCAAHHRAAHDGELHIEGKVSTGLRFYHADGSEYGDAMKIAPTVVDQQTKAFQALRQLGFREREAREALAGVIADVAPEGDVEAALRGALDVLTAGAFRRAS